MIDAGGPLVLCLHGYKGVGKSTLARQLDDYLRINGKMVRLTSFAEPLKKLCSEIMNAVGVQPADEIRKALYTKHKERPHFPEGQAGRDFMVDLSQNFIKKYYGVDVWADKTLQSIQNSYLEWGADFVIIDDLRFDSELKYLLDNGCKCIVIDIGGDHSTFTGEDFTIDESYIDIPVWSSGAKFSMGVVRTPHLPFLQYLAEAIDKVYKTKYT